MKPSEREKWVVVAQFTAFDMGIMADLAVSKLQGSGIPAMRMPTGRISGVFDRAFLAAHTGPIRVVVPPEEEDRARDILAEQFDDDVLADQ